MPFQSSRQYIHMDEVQYIEVNSSAFQEILEANGLTQHELILVNTNIAAQYSSSSMAIYNVYCQDVSR